MGGSDFCVQTKERVPVTEKVSRDGLSSQSLASSSLSLKGPWSLLQPCVLPASVGARDVPSSVLWPWPCGFFVREKMMRPQGLHPYPGVGWETHQALSPWRVK